MVRFAVCLSVDVLDYQREGGQASTSARHFQPNLGHHVDESHGLHAQGDRTGQHQEGIQGKWVSFLYIGSFKLLRCLWPNDIDKTNQILSYCIVSIALETADLSCLLPITVPGWTFPLLA